VEEQAEPQQLQHAIGCTDHAICNNNCKNLNLSLSTRWNNWQSDFEMYITASGIMDSKQKRALLLYQAELRVREILKQIPETGTDADYDIAKQKLKAYFDPQPVIIVGNRIISLLFVEENKNKRDHRDIQPTDQIKSMHKEI
jgi:hypothetical protein